MGGKGTLYYNAAAGPLPTGPRALKLKTGLNAWAEMLHADLAPVAELPGWWAADVELGEVGFEDPWITLCWVWSCRAGARSGVARLAGRRPEAGRGGPRGHK